MREMHQQPVTARRDWLSRSVLAAAATMGGVWTFPALTQGKPRSRLERLGVGVIGLRYQGSVIADKARLYGDIVAVADVDQHVRQQAKASFGSTPRDFEDYRQLISRPEVDVVLIGAPDHWHAKMLIDACRAGKDVYCEKPLTLTIDEGKPIREVVGQTGRVVQVGSWQRSDHRFRLAVEMVRQGRIGQLQRVEVTLGPNEVGGPFETRPVPHHINWDLWLGQAPDVPYLPQRSHYTFRWWHEYSGGQMTDWGAHHLDIARWAIGADPVRVEGSAEYPPTDAHSYNVPARFSARYLFPDNVELTVSDSGRNGILFVGDQGRLFVNRGSLSGTPVDRLSDQPLPRESFQLYQHDNLERPERAGKLDAIINHIGNFFDAVSNRFQPISDVASQQRTACLCHMGNIAMQLGRPLEWDAESECFGDDAEANLRTARPQRAGYEVV
jgi:myo-inositol 2-dehydrogenase/D-chiro-inositol 1-dehydrogenase